MLKLRKFTVAVLIMFILVSLISYVKATDDPITLNIVSDDNTIENLVENTTENIVQNLDINTNTNTSTYTNEDLPQTGVTEDITVMFFIIVCAISAVYAYVKIKNYNV